MKPTKVLYYDGEKLIYTYEYRGFKYTKEFKKMLKEYGLKVTKLIDNYLDKKIYKITFEDEENIHIMEFIRHSQEYTILNSKNKKNYLI